MYRTVFTLLFTLSLLLSACAQVAPVNPTSAPGTPSDNQAETPYPQPENPDPGAPSVTYPYPDADQPSGNAPGLTDDQRYTQKRLNSDFAPDKADHLLVTGPVYFEMDNTQLFITEKDSSETVLHLVGHVPNPCYHLRVLVHEPDEGNNVLIEIYSVADPEKVCVEMLQPFDETILLEKLPAGKYMVFINDQEWGALNVK